MHSARATQFTNYSCHQAFALGCFKVCFKIDQTSRKDKFTLNRRDAKSTNKPL